jgi:glycosyltransferase involved in cell wall biosynthesis
MSVGGSQEWIVNFCCEMQNVDILILSVFGENAYAEKLKNLTNVSIRHLSSAKGTNRHKLVFFIPYVLIKFLLMRNYLQVNFDWVNVRLPLSMLLWSISGLARVTNCHYNVDCDVRQLFWYERFAYKHFLSRFRSVSIVSSVRSGYSFTGIAPEDLLEDPTFVTTRSSSTAIEYRHQFNFLFVARLVRQKGIDLALRIMNEISRSQGNMFHLHVFGDGPDRKRAEKFCSDMGIECVSFYGFATNISDYIPNSVGLLKTSIGEPVNSIAREFMLAGRRVFATIEVGDDEHLANTGLIVPIRRDRIEDSAKIITEVIQGDRQNPARLAQLLQTASAEFSNSTTRDYFYNLINSKGVKAK